MIHQRERGVRLNLLLLYRYCTVKKSTLERGRMCSAYSTSPSKNRCPPCTVILFWWISYWSTVLYLEYWMSSPDLLRAHNNYVLYTDTEGCTCVVSTEVVLPTQRTTRPPHQSIYAHSIFYIHRTSFSRDPGEALVWRPIGICVASTSACISQRYVSLRMW